MTKRILVLGADRLGFDLKEAIKNNLENDERFRVIDVSADAAIPYYDVGAEVGKAISADPSKTGIIFCGSGMGVNIVANKFRGVYCGLCESVTTARLCRIINNCNVLSLGALTTSPYKAQMMVDAFLSTDFSFGLSEIEPEGLQYAFQEVRRIETNNLM
ncbi:MAG: RpiB/LacA/LacB family sugar-phosphate isomerase [Burkholderiaceae bacterium]|nr:RpiB/LacA/LacB family sugar-phosphate isomerase [Burkholderiaceae bacterium]